MTIFRTPRPPSQIPRIANIAGFLSLERPFFLPATGTYCTAKITATCVRYLPEPSAQSAPSPVGIVWGGSGCISALGFGSRSYYRRKFAGIRRSGVDSAAPVRSIHPTKPQYYRCPSSRSAFPAYNCLKRGGTPGKKNFFLFQFIHTSSLLHFLCVSVIQSTLRGKWCNCVLA